MAFFPGSSIGNFSPNDARGFLSGVSEVVGSGGQLLIGVDRKKDAARLEAAYNDSAGVTAQFNLNVMTHLNATIGTDFDVDAYEHVARYNEALGCIQMFLCATRDQVVHLGEESFAISAGEEIHTENSFKYHPEEFLKVAASAGWRLEAQWSDADALFSVYLLKAD